MRRSWASVAGVTVVLAAAAACGGGGGGGGHSAGAARPFRAPSTPVGSTLGAAASVDAGTSCPASHFRLEPTPVAARQARRLVARMSLSQEVDLMHGLGQNGGTADTVGSTAPIPSLHIPSLNQEDGPGGVGDGDTGVTQLPAPIAVAATFDQAAARCYGQVIGTEARAKGIQVMYGPTINMVRLPQWGRAFESYGEDPYLAGTLGAADVEGIQSAGTMAEVKHYAVYNQETFRNTPADDAVVARQALHEIYLKAWQTVVAADPAAIMCSYSTINGVAACQNRALIHTFLDQRLGFAGFVGSDYNATKSTVASADAGLDQEQPGSAFFGKSLVSAVTSGKVRRSVIDEAATRILTQMYRFRMFTDDASVQAHRDVATSADATVARDVAEQSLVLLKNKGSVLPLARGASVAVIGLPASTATTSGGGGTAYVVPTHVVTPLSGIQAAVSPGTHVTYTPGLPATTALTPVPSADLAPAYPTSGTLQPFSTTLTVTQAGTYVLGLKSSTAFQTAGLKVDGTALSAPGAIRLTAGKHQLSITGATSALTWATPADLAPQLAAATKAAAAATTAVVVVSDPTETEGSDRATLSLPSAQDELIEAVAAANPRTVVVIEAGAAVTMPWLASVAGVVDQWYPGEADGAALAAVLYGAVDPSGHLPVTFPVSLAQTPASTPAEFPGLAGKVTYAEGVNIGYRWWIDTGHNPLFPFGFGLSYTSFSYATPITTLHVVGGEPVVTVTTTVTNTGHNAGADVAQVYLGLPSPQQPLRQLEGYQRVKLVPGASTSVTFTLRGLQLAEYDGGGWHVPAGTYSVYVGDSSAKAQLDAPVKITVPTSYTVPEK